jgi:hypothetical protein
VGDLIEHAVLGQGVGSAHVVALEDADGAGVEAVEPADGRHGVDLSHVVIEREMVACVKYSRL